MVAAQDLRQFLDGSVREFLGHRRADDTREIGLGSDTLHHRRIGRDDHIVLIHTPRVIALRLQHTHDAHGYRLKADGLTDTVGTLAEELLHDGGTHHAHLGGLLDVLLGEALALLYRPQTDIEIVDRLAIHRGIGVLTAVDSLSAGRHLWRHLRDKPLLAHDALIVGHLQCLHRRRILAHAASHIGTRANRQQVGTHRGEFLTDALLRALTDRHHDDHRCHSDDDTQHREKRAHLIIRHRPQTYFEKI